ncbi:Bax inhibitor-1/YccA family protein [Acidicapsa ligni]|uniref:Bax inhibitor-1/YccA family protein n=1 Tax=Acidicapsa ligni TaxID=542300 RepID=UPI0021E0207B|nr:Bax inhibitor-1/YccA family protein [Acidicapsa ligni]
MPQLMRTSNPALSDSAFRGQPNRGAQAIPYGTQGQYGERFGRGGGFSDITSRMTLNGTINKTGILLVCAIATAGWTWHLFMQSGNPADVGPWLFGGLIGGFICALITIFKKEWSPVTAPAYALLEGLALGGISAMYNVQSSGIAIQAVGLTFGTLFVLLLAYRSGLIKVTEKFRLGIIAATGGVAVFYLLEMVLGIFGIHFTSINGSGVIGIGFSLIVVCIAALNLVLDFDFIEKGVQYGAPKYMEWYGAFGIMVTLVWLYLEMLRLLSKVSRRN